MILLDDREGSGPLFAYPPLDTLASLTRLDYGDAAFTGNGPTSTTWIGVEVKSLFDLVSSLDTKRLQATQIPGMLAEYDITYLLVYGLCRPCPRTGNLLVPGKRGWSPHHLGSRPVTYSYVYRSLLSLEAAGVRIVWLPQMKEEGQRAAAAWLGEAYSWWQKDWNAHTLFQCFDQTQDMSEADYRRHDPNASASMPVPVDPGKFRVARTMASFSGVGYKRAVAISNHLPSLLAVIHPASCDWTPSERKQWREEVVAAVSSVPGVGKTTARSIVAALEGG